MHGRSTDLSDRVDENGVSSRGRSELSAMLSGQQPHARLVSHRSSLRLPGKSLYTVPENQNEEISEENADNKTSRVNVNRQRSSAASILLNNLKNKRNANTVSLRDSNGIIAAGSNTTMTGGQRPSIEVIVGDPGPLRRQKSLENPIHHYEIQRNVTARPKSLSTTETPTVRSDLSPLVRTKSALRFEIIDNKRADSRIEFSAPKKERASGIDYKHGGKFFPQGEMDASLESDNVDKRPKLNEDEQGLSDKNLESLLEGAIAEDIFSRVYALDNKFEEAAEVELPSYLSSGPSPLTTPGVRKLSRQDSDTIEDFQRDLDKYSRESSGVGHMTRLQMKMDAMKSKYDSFVINRRISADSSTIFGAGYEASSSGSSTFGLERESHSDKDWERDLDSPDGRARNQPAKFWLNADLGSKLLTESMSNQLRSIERFPSSGIVGEKVMLSRIKEIAANQENIASKRPTSPSPIATRKSETNGKNGTRPNMKTGEANKPSFEEQFRFVKGNARVDDDGLTSLEMGFIKDDVLRRHMALGKTATYKMWHASEAFEFKQVASMANLQNFAHISEASRKDTNSSSSPHMSSLSSDSDFLSRFDAEGSLTGQARRHSQLRT
ncbi:LAMI_0E12068g1_1 [Lachancea mirantina]|uniref:LAMI_0E12068g1_1 n=1 Tax=Lachancea mirantina TaxID=1230905 RepID=A0A1G4JQ27_9SACH|nr:LAMI_0E12068g1_1 [Lachancea mirantina]